jgi:transposase
MWGMGDDGQGVDRAGRRRKRFLTSQEKYEIWLQLLRRESTIAEAAQRAGVDPGTVMKLREVAKQGALDALAASRPGVRHKGVDRELAEAKAEIERLSKALTEMGVRLMLLEGKGAGTKTVAGSRVESMRPATPSSSVSVTWD